MMRNCGDRPAGEHLVGVIKLLYTASNQSSNCGRAWTEFIASAVVILMITIVMCAENTGLKRIINMTSENMTLWCCFNYNNRAETKHHCEIIYTQL